MNDLHHQILNSITFNESITVIGFKDDGLHDIVYELITEKEIRNYIETKIKKPIAIRNLGIMLLERMSGTTSRDEQDFLHHIGIREISQEMLTNLFKSPKRIVLIISDIHQLKDPAKTISTFDQISKYFHKKVTFIYLVNNIESYVDYSKSLESNSSFFENTIYHPLSIQREKKYLEDHCLEKYGAINNKKTQSKVFLQSHGHYELYKRLYKAQITGNMASLGNYARRLTNSLGKSSIRAFRKVINKIDLNEHEKHIIDIYKKLGFIKKENITIPLLKKYILELAPQENILFDKDSGHLSFQNIQDFSKAEIKVIKALLENENEVVTKEQIGEIIWGEKVGEKYSPWAIDQTIFRMRLKFDKLNLNAEIKTIHGRGYMFIR